MGSTEEWDGVAGAVSNGGLMSLCCLRIESAFECAAPSIQGRGIGGEYLGWFGYHGVLVAGLFILD